MQYRVLIKPPRLPQAVPDGPTDGTSSGVHWMVLGLPGGGRGEHRRPLPHASWSLSRHAPHGFHCVQQAIVALAALRLSESFPPEAVQRAWTVRHGRALPSRRQQGEPRSRREMVSREGPLLHVVSRRSCPMRLRMVLCHMRPSARSEGTASHTHHVRGSRHERAPTGRLLHEATLCGRTARLGSLSC